MEARSQSSSHLLYTIPPAVVLSACYYPLCTSIDVYKVLFLIAVSQLDHLGELQYTKKESDCPHSDYSMGFIPHSSQNMDIPRGRHCRANFVQDSRGRGILLHYPDLQYLSSVSHPQQAYPSLHLPPGRETTPRW